MTTTSKAGKILEDSINGALSQLEFIEESLLEGAGLSRIYSYVSRKIPFAMITAYRHNNSSKTNDSLNSQLISSLNSKGLGGIQLIGYWQEAGDSEPTREKSFFVPYTGNDEPTFRRLMADMCGRYDQDAVLYSNGESIGFLTRGGQYSPAFSGMSFGDSQIKQGWSELRGKKFTMVESGFYTGSNTGRQLLSYHGIIPSVMFERKSIQEALNLKNGKK